MSSYYLNHSELPAEVQRLEYQHGVLVSAMGNALLPAPVEAFLKELTLPPAVADVGTGTGIWLADLAQHLPDTARLDGYDYNTTKFRPPATLPPNVQLQFANALEAFPEALHGVYDVVHVRLLVLGLKANDWQTIAERLLPLLRPGGYLVWEDIQVSSFVATTVRPDAAPAATTATTTLGTVMEQMKRFYASSTGESPYPAELHSLFSQVGYSDTSNSVYKIDDIWTNDRPLYDRMKHAVFLLIFGFNMGMVGAGGFEDVKTPADAARVAASVKKDLDDDTAKVDFWIYRAVGRKAVAA